MKRSPVLKILMLMALAVLFLLIARYSDIACTLSPQAITARLARAGGFAPLLFMGIMAVTVASPLPSLPLDIAAGAFFGPALGTLYSATGALAGAIISFSIARLLGRDMIERFLRGHINFCTACSDRLLTAVIFFTRLLPVVSFDLVSYGAGLTKMSVKRFSLATFLGMLPLTFIYNYFGSVLVIDRHLAVVLGLVMVFLFFLVPFWIERYAPVTIRGMFRHHAPATIPQRADSPEIERTGSSGKKPMGGTIILNNGPIPETKPDIEIAALLRSDINRLKGEFYDLERGRVDYKAMRGSDAYRQYVECTRLLREYDLSRLGTREERLAFWVNLYNTLVIHGIIELEIRETVKEIPRFFRRIAYEIGGMVFTPDDIEHGILRGNHRPFHRLLPPFSQTDPRRSLIISPPDPRIHFTLVCGSSSCPPINFYTPERIEQQLDIAAAGFINGPEVEVMPELKLLRLSPIFRWYSPDFGGHSGIVETLVRYLDQGDARDFLTAHGTTAKIEWKFYNWRLNR
ncbi:MAG: hypothetical protein FD174_2722 [Geobacteraceae bacterium]|nr:MAG: hypothetical protein FD174_2722 [Geobacteraceae bacterium]